MDYPLAHVARFVSGYFEVDERFGGRVFIGDGLEQRRVVDLLANLLESLADMLAPLPNPPNGLKIQPDKFLLCLILPDINGLRGHQTALVGNAEG